jgi:predicted O-linked N-acetylglucosamine transferase (SPINDLY family)
MATYNKMNTAFSDQRTLLLNHKQKGVGGRVKDNDENRWIDIMVENLNRLEEAVEAYDQAIRLNPEFADAYYNKANTLSLLKCHDQALKCYDDAIALRPSYGEALYNRGAALQELKRPEEALISYDWVTALNPYDAEAFNNKGVLFQHLGRMHETLENYDKAITLKTDFFEALNNRGNPLRDLMQFDEALKSMGQAILIKSDYAEAFNNRGVTLNVMKRFDEALQDFDNALSIRSDYADAHYNRGNTLHELKRFDEALKSYDKAILINKDHAEALNNRGVTFNAMNRFDEALQTYDQAILINADYADAHYNRGILLDRLKYYDEALASYEKAMSLKPNYDWLIGSWLHIRMQTCEWSNFHELLAQFKADLQNGENVTLPFPVLGFFDDLQLQLTAAQLWIRNKFPPQPIMAPFQRKNAGQKIRIGYFSADFHNHATAYLMAELFERHDRANFEIIAFSFGPDAADEMRKRLQGSFDRFLDVRSHSDQEIAEMSRVMEIDIAVDLKGFTREARTGIFAHRCAPVQVNYIGYPGTMAADYIDYIVADRVLIPVESQTFYSEKIVYLPDSYQVNDTNRKISDRVFSRMELELPQDGFVFCCFNNSYKILPSMFDCWMRILKSVPGSVIWLLEDNATSVTNLRREATNRGVSPDRLVFAKRLPLADHLARHRCADLFLDTLPCNAHTTASDALWAGLPVLTQIGESFAARVAASLLAALDLPELITTTMDDYEHCAIKLATDPQALQRLKQRLADGRLSSTLFDTSVYVKQIEAAYCAMHARHQSGLAPDHIYL